MASTYTTNLGIEKIGTGEQSGTWGDTTNTNFDILDEAVNGIISVTLSSAGSSGSPTALPITDGASSNGRNKFIEFVDGGDLGGTAYVQLTPNNAEKVVHIRNSLSSSRSVIVFQGTYNASNDFEIVNGADVLLKFNGGGSGATVTDVNVDLTVTGATIATADINGGTIDGAVIGGASAAAGTFTTFTSNGIDDNADAVAITIDSSENVGIGTTSPVTRLEVEGSGTELIRASSSSGNSGSATGTGALGLDFFTASTHPAVLLSAIEGGTSTYLSDFTVALRASNADAAPTERMRIDSSGNVGIGTASPARTLDVSSGSAGVAITTKGSGTGSYITFQDGTTTNDAKVRVGAVGDNLTLFGGGSERMRIDSSGNVLVGKTSSGLTTAGSQITSASILQSASSTSTNLATNSGAAINLCNTSATDGNFSNIGGYNSNGLVVSQINFVNPSHSSRTGAITFTTHSGSAFSEAMRIDSSGGVIFKGSLASHQTNAGVVEYSSNVTSIHSYGATSGTGVMRFLTGGGGGSGTSERMRIIDSGLVGIGTSTPQSPLQLNKTPPTAFGSPFLSIGHATYTGSGMYTIAFGYEAAGGSNAPAEIGMVTTSDSSFTKGDLVFATRDAVTDTAPTERARITSAGNLLVGCTSFGSVSTEGCQLGNSGTAIFSNDSDIPLYLNRTTSGVTTSQVVVSFFRNDVQSGTIGVSQGGTPAFGAPSDIRLKENVADHKSELTNVMALRPVSWDWKDSSKGAGEGFVAQELEQTAWSDLVSDGEDGYKMVSGLGAVETRLIKALQEAVTRIETLEAEVTALKGE